MSEFEEWFKRVRKLMDEFDKMFEEIAREPFIEGRRGARVVGPYYYGFSVEIGPDGVPKVREWGNIRPGPVKPVIRDTIEPFTDIFDEGDYYRIVVDIPGVDKEQINIEATENSLTISTSGERRYYKEVTFRDPIKPETAKAQYKNGVLTITVEKKIKKEKEKGVRIKVE
ncbi:Hsp20/alpha crystallin family protein [Infirmifilum lucidum]|uniref:Hsp20/alpha crystallin family protein n=1 Tax=Infirmifilum lucidum TaxID=2776706 RepID=A0A7L9FFN6_9CREN|nr:archaeal heat shock protein Hsp20 [Infirmifilum lucidum]QOJ78172.1 Hsp20/alpha crystallin family protein [Infirmifilum lucidum]